MTNTPIDAVGGTVGGVNEAVSFASVMTAAAVAAAADERRRRRRGGADEDDAVVVSGSGALLETGSRFAF